MKYMLDTQEQFVKKCKLVHGDKYDYGKVIYTGTRNKITVVCPIHGDFEITANNHTSAKKGCQKCGIESMKAKNRLTQDEFIDKCKRIYGDKYNYNKTVYGGVYGLITVTCPIHGDFNVEAASHTKQISGCPKCGKIKRSIATRLSQFEFIEKCKIVHGDKYDYSKTVYTTSRNKIDIICKEHGIFNQKPFNHLNGCGCPDCGNEEQSKNRIKSSHDYISECIKAHNGKYTYKNTVYKGGKNKITVTCIKHGDFEVSPMNHLHLLQGCAKCNSSHGESITMSILDELHISYKIQKTFNDCKHKRLLPFDFQVFNNDNEFFLLEIDGEQHKKPTRIKGVSIELANINFLETLKRDKIKNEWASKNNIKLYRVDYGENKFSQLKMDIFSVLSKEFPQLKISI